MKINVPKRGHSQKATQYTLDDIIKCVFICSSLITNKYCHEKKF